MRLLKYNDDGEFSLTDSFGDETPQYAILSHTWEAEEVTFKDLMDGTSMCKAGYRKIQFCGEQARRDNLQYFWVDTCCIDKSSSAELAEAINSMFQWYSRAVKCYVYLSDVSVPDHDGRQLTWELDFRKSRWFTRGWTLQELIAPESVEFFSCNGKRLGDRTSLVQQIHEITGIASRALQGASLDTFSVDERFSWAAKRQTTRKEDKAYCLLGIFDIYLPPIYGERDNAFKRLKVEIAKASTGLNSHPTSLPYAQDAPFNSLVKPPTLTSMYSVARSLRSQGKYKEAEVMHRQVLQHREIMLGKDHLDTLHSIMEIAASLYEQGKYIEAEAMYRQVLQLREIVLGRKHPETLTSLHGVAVSLHEQGKYKEAVTMHRQVLQLRETVLGKDHLDTLNSMMDIAASLHEQGKCTEAEAMYRQALQLRQTVLGKEHPDTLTSLCSVARALRSQNKYKEAEAMHWQALQLRETVLGKDHLDTLNSIMYIAALFYEQGKYIEAEVMYRQALRLRQTILGRKHPETLASLHGVAISLHEQGKYADAEAMYQQAL